MVVILAHTFYSEKYEKDEKDRKTIDLHEKINNKILKQISKITTKTVNQNIDKIPTVIFNINSNACNINIPIFLQIFFILSNIFI